MTGDEIKALRRTLDLTARKLGGALGVDQATVLAWEREELFPTKRHVDAMRRLLEDAAKGRANDPGDTERADAAIAVTKTSAGAGAVTKALADPAFWRLVRKLAAHPALREKVEKAAEPFEDPAED